MSRLMVETLQVAGGNEYQFIPPMASNTDFGGVKAKPKTTEHNEAAISPDGRLYVGTNPEIVEARTATFTDAAITVPHFSLKERLDFTDDQLYEVIKEITRATSSVDNIKYTNLKERIDTDINNTRTQIINANNSLKTKNAYSDVGDNVSIPKDGDMVEVAYFNIEALEETDVEMNCNFALSIESQNPNDTLSISNVIAYSLGTELQCEVMVDELAIAGFSKTFRIGKDVFSFSLPINLNKGSHIIRVKMLNEVKSEYESIDKLKIIANSMYSICYIRGQFIEG